MQISKPAANSRSAYVFILTSVIVDALGASMLMPVVPALLMEVTGEGVAQVAIYGGWLGALFSIAQFLTAPVLGALSDCYGRKPVLLVSLTAFAVSYAIFGLAHDIHWLFVAPVLAGACAGTVSTATAYVADITGPETRVRSIGMVFAALSAGFMVGPLFGGMLAGYGTRVPFFAAAGLALLNAAFGLLVLPESLRVESRRPFSFKRATPVGMFVHMRSRALLFQLLGALGFVQIAATTVPIIWSYISMLRFGWSQAEVGVSFSLYVVATIVGQSVLASRVSRRIGSGRSACVGLAFLAITLIGLAFVDYSWAMLAMMLPAAIAGITGPAMVDYMSRQTPDNAQGELQGSVASVNSAANIVTPLVMTQIFTWLSAEDALVYFPGAPFILAAGLACVGLALVMRTLRQDEALNGQLTARGCTPE